MIDIYMKAVLTVIAAALATIALQGLVSSSSAQSECGSNYTRPCYVKVLDLGCGGGLITRTCSVTIER